MSSPQHASTAKPGDAPRSASYFTGLAQTYAAHRPTYPIEAIRFLLQGASAPLDVADVGCGTGISTRLLAQQPQVKSIIGIDPNSDMLTEARREQTSAGARVQYQGGTGEQTSLPAASIDLVVCAQSFHWFDHARALKEFARILRSEWSSGQPGRLGLMWNLKDADDPFTAEYTSFTEQAQRDAATRGLIVPSERQADPTLGNWFCN